MEKMRFLVADFLCIFSLCRCFCNRLRHSHLSPSLSDAASFNTRIGASCRSACARRCAFRHGCFCRQGGTPISQYAYGGLGDFALSLFNFAYPLSHISDDSLKLKKQSLIQRTAFVLFYYLVGNNLAKVIVKHNSLFAVFHKGYSATRKAVFSSVFLIRKLGT